MKRFRSVVSIVVMALSYEMIGFSPGFTQTAVAQSAGSTVLTAAELEELLGPIALYPDDLLANVLAASVYPEEVQEAFNFVKSGGDTIGIDMQDWEQPVKAVAKLPDVVKMMGEYMDWTTALGQAYLTQAQAVMAAVQSLRDKASANGVLESTNEQDVIVEGDTIYIEYADPEVIYVPSYDPQVVYVEHYDDSDVFAAGLIGFGVGVVVGAAWNDLDCDWHHGCIGWGDVDIDIDRNVDIGDINIGNSIGGDRVNHRNRVGQAGAAWSPNKNKDLATRQPDKLQNYKGTNAARATARGTTPRASSAGRAPTATSRPATPSSATRGSAGRQPSATRVPKTPSSTQANSAFRGGSNTRATSNRGSSSRQSALRSRSGRSSASRGGGGSRSSGSRGGGGRRGGRR